MPLEDRRTALITCLRCHKAWQKSLSSRVGVIYIHTSLSVLKLMAGVSVKMVVSARI